MVPKKWPLSLATAFLALLATLAGPALAEDGRLSAAAGAELQAELADATEQVVSVDLSHPDQPIKVRLPKRGDATFILLSPEDAAALRPNAPAAGYTLANGDRVELRVLASEVVAKFRDERAAQSLSSRAQSGGALTLERTKSVDGNLGSFSLKREASDGSKELSTGRAALASALDELNGRPDVEYALPVYYHANTATRMWPTDRIIVGVSDPSVVYTILATFPELVDGGHVLMDESQRIFRVAGQKGFDPLAIADRIAREFGEQGVVYAEPDFHQDYKKMAAPNDTLFADCWHLHNTGQAIAGGAGRDNPTVDVDVDAPEAWDVTTGVGIVVAVVDDGLETTHPDINLYTNSADPAGGGDQDGNGLTDDVNGWDFRANDNNPNPGSGDDHGTSVSGVAVGKGNNNLGTTGAAYGARVMPCKVADLNGFASSSVLANAINYAWTKADVINCSWGGGAASSAIQTAIKNANNKGRNGLGSLVLIANGNSATGFIKASLTGLSAGTWGIEWRYTKNASTSTGADSVWLDDISLPGVAAINFENATPPALPSGFTTSGNQNWTTVADGTHFRSGTRSAKAGAITHNQTTSIFFNGALSAGDISYHVWYDTQQNGDVFDIRLTSGANSYGPYVALSGASNQWGYQASGAQQSESFPSAHPEAISVAAVAADGYRSNYSQYGTFTDFGAPSDGHNFNAAIATIDRSSTLGYNTASGTAGNYCTAGGINSDGYPNGFGGTSSATPLSAGVAALTIAANPNLSHSQVRDALRRTAVKMAGATYSGGAGDWLGGRNDQYGYGMLNAANAVNFAQTGTKGTAQMAADIVVSEVMGAPAAGGVEYIELYNKSTTATYTLTGFGVTDNEMFDDTGEGALQFPTGTTMPPRSMILVVVNGAANSAFVSAVTSNAAGANGPAGGAKVFEASNSGLSYGGSAIPDMTSVGGALSLTDSGDNIAFAFIGGDEVTYRGDVVDGMSYGSVSMSTGNDNVIGPGVLEGTADTAPSAGQSSQRAGLGKNGSSSTDFSPGSSDPGAWSALGGGAGSAPASPASITYPASSATGAYTVSWAASTGATSYTLDRSSNGGSSWSQVASGSGTSFNESVGNGSYRYRVLASNSFGSSAYRTGSTDCVVSIPVGTNNDNFANATVVSGASGSVNANNATATKETGEPNHGGNAGGKSLWWSWTPSGSGSATIETVGSSYDTTLGVYTGSAVNSLATIGSNDDIQSGNTASRVTFTASAGTTYRIAVDGYNAASGNITLSWSQVTANPPAAPTGLTYPASSSTGSYTVSWNASSGATSYTLQRSANGGSSWSTVSSPAGTSYAESLSANGSYRYRVSASNAAGASAYATGSTDCVVNIPVVTTNDAFANARTMAGSRDSDTGSNVGFTKEASEPSHAGNAGGASAWWKWTAPATGSVTIDTFGSSYDTTLAVYTGSAVGSLSAVASNDDTAGSGDGRQSRVTFNASSGVTYRVAVDGYKSSTGTAATGSIALNWDQVVAAAPAAPASITYPASSSTGNFSVSWAASSGATSYRVERTANGGSTWTQVYNGSSASYSESVAAGTYSYRVNASNTGGTSAWRTGTTNIVVSVAQPTGNNTFASSGSLTGATGATTGSNAGATKEVGEPNHGGNSGGKSIWWRWTAPSSGTATFNTFGSSFDTTMSAYTGSAVNALTSRASNDDSGGTLQSQVSFAATAGTTYHIAVDGYNGASGSVSLSWTLSTGRSTAVIAIEHAWPEDLEAMLMVGDDPEAPLWFVPVTIPAGASGDLAIQVDLAQAVEFLPPTADRPWSLYVRDHVEGAEGAVTWLRVRHEGLEYAETKGKLPTAIPDAGGAVMVRVNEKALGRNTAVALPEGEGNATEAPLPNAPRQ